MSNTNGPMINKMLLDKEDEAEFSPSEIKRDTDHRVLVVDDNENSAQTIGWLLEMQGCDVRLAFTGADAIAMVSKYNPDYVFLDISIPDMNGYEICHLMKTLPGMEKTIFVAQTGWSDKEFIERSRLAGFDHHLVKPIEPASLKDILQKRPE